MRRHGGESFYDDDDDEDYDDEETGESIQMITKQKSQDNVETLEDLYNDKNED